MIIKQIIKKLSTRNGLFVSFYIPIRPGETRKEFVTTFRSHLKDLKHAAKNLRHREEKYFDAIIKRIEDFLDTADTHNTKSFAIFAGKDFFEAIKLLVEIPLRVHVGTKPLLSPLTTAIEENPPFLVVLIDRESARVIEVNLGEEEARSKMIKSDVPQRILAKGNDMGRESKILRHIEEHLHRHLEKVLIETKRFEKSYQDGLIIIGAQKELVGRFKGMLSKDFKPKVVGSFGANVDDNETEVVKKAEKIIDSYLERRAWHEI